MNILLLFTNNYPSKTSNEHIFLREEIQYLRNKFDKVVIIPSSVLTGSQGLLSESVYVESDFAVYLETQKKKVRVLNFLALFSKSLWNEFFRNSEIMNYSFLIEIARTKTFSGFTKRWMRRYYKKMNYVTDNVILYTYWTNYITLGLSEFRKEKNNIKIITRAHGIDLFDSRGNVVFREKLLSNLDRFYVVSLDALNYMNSKYPTYKYKTFFSPIGVKKAAVLNNIVNENEFILVSCSNVIEIKRVELIAEALLLLNKKDIGKKIKWFHFGDGSMFSKLNEFTKKLDSHQNIQCFLKGRVENEEIISFYQDNQVNLFISTSSTEGGRPISIQEAQSFGIPVLATEVGGIPEIINQTNGKLLRADPTPDEIAEAILYFIRNDQMAPKLRQNSYLNWEKNLNPCLHTSKFADDIYNLI